MVDIHHHLLFGVDDGSKSLEQSVAMVEMAVADGTTHIVATPHANDTYPYDRARNEAILGQIREALPSATADRITLGLGCDFHLNWDNTADARTNGSQYAINGGEYVLIELPDVGIPKRIVEVLYAMRVDGFTPILTHPERNLTLQRSPEKLREWMESGLLVQVTAGSLAGTFGSTAEGMAWDLVKKNWAHFVASDAHNLDRRSPRLGEARRLVAERRGEETAQRLFLTNPLAVFNGAALPPQPEPSGVFAQAAMQDDYEEKKPAFWRRLLGL